MSNIIDKESQKSHTIEKFEFRSIEDIKEIEPKDSEMEFDELQESFENNSDTSEDDSASIDINELLEKIDKLSDENVKLSLKLEESNKEYEERLKHEKELSYKEGKEDGIKEATSSLQEPSEELNTQLLKSITTLDEKLIEINGYLSNIEDQLKDASIIIAKKVIKKELEKNSHIIASNLAKSLLSDLKDATHIKLKVHPHDEKYLISELKELKNIEIEADDAINKGGIIILSDIGNIDNNISTRLQKAISLIQEED